MNKKIVIILAIISVLILISGISTGMDVIRDLKASKITEPVYIDGSDATDVMIFFQEVGTWILGIAFIIYSIGIIAAIWIVYGIVMLIIHIVNRKKNKISKNNINA